MSASVVSVISRFLEEYLSSTPQRLKLLDAYLLYILLTGALHLPENTDQPTEQSGFPRHLPRASLC
ncbi:DAD1 isoform 3 [Pan troglodytes]|uniref:Defender against cell death 1 n=2 Tax=Homininae TaxID=207598 RepID=F5H895_HUMAN|nr:defender against cell death 1 [Homo sapiens]KAI4059960.1 defender against cell death 1 [Homo sapiens]PNI96467.1 DAD1 isoform 3 [Pan troglodytes]